MSTVSNEHWFLTSYSRMSIDSHSILLRLISKFSNSYSMLLQGYLALGVISSRVYKDMSVFIGSWTWIATFETATNLITRYSYILVPPT